MISLQWMMMFMTTMLIVEAYDRKFEILGKYENSSPSSVSFIIVRHVKCIQTKLAFPFSAKLISHWLTSVWNFLSYSDLCRVIYMYI